MDETVWDPHEVTVTLCHPFGDLELSLHEWMLSGPGLRRLVRPTSARSSRTGEQLPLTVIPLAYRHNGQSRALIESGEIENPWPPLGTVGSFRLPQFHRYNGLLAAKYVSHETVAACGRLITATARLSELMLAQLWQQTRGPDWGTVSDEAKDALAGFDTAWQNYETALADYNPRRADDQLRAAIDEALKRIDRLITRFPPMERRRGFR